MGYDLIQVREMTDKCACDPAFYVEKLTDGIYAMGNKRCLIRVSLIFHVGIL